MHVDPHDLQITCISGGKPKDSHRTEADRKSRYDFETRSRCEASTMSVSSNLKENQVLTSLKEFFVDLEEGCFDNRSEGVTVCTNPTLSVSITIAPEAPAIFPSNQLRSHGLSSGHATICESHTARRCPR